MAAKNYTPVYVIRYIDELGNENQLLGKYRSYEKAEHIRDGFAKEINFDFWIMEVNGNTL